MSDTLNQAINATLTGSAALVALLGTDPDGGPAVYYRHKPETPVYPCVIFRDITISPVTALANIQAGAADVVTYDFEVWSSKPGWNAIRDIYRAIDPLLHRQQLVMADSAHNRMWACMRQAGCSPSQYDSNLHLSFGFFRYVFYVWNG